MSAPGLWLLLCGMPEMLQCNPQELVPVARGVFEICGGAKLELTSQTAVALAPLSGLCKTVPAENSPSRLGRKSPSP